MREEWGRPFPAPGRAIRSTGGGRSDSGWRKPRPYTGGTGGTGGAGGAGGYWLYDATGTARFRVPAPTVHDALGRSGSATLALTESQATVTIDATFLATAAYPVTVDPTV